MYWLYYVIGPIAGGLIAASALVLTKTPNANKLLNRIMPYKTMIGVGMLALFVLNAIDILPNIGHIFARPLWGITLVAVLSSELLLGLLLGLPQIAKWASGKGMAGQAEERAALVSKRMVKFEVPIGILSMTAGVLAALYLARIL